MKVLLTGVAGFIGFHTARYLLERGDEVVGVDNVNDYYDVGLKESRLAQIRQHPNFRFERVDLAERKEMERIFEAFAPQRVVHLAAQPGVRYSVLDPHVYVKSNLVGFLHVLEGARHARVEHLVFASSSSVYGANTKMPFSVHDNVDHPVSLYAATKKSNELMAHSYSHLFALPVTGLRFFTVYGPWGRPDMVPLKFIREILESRPIDVYNHGKMERDFTYVDDIVEGTVRVLDHPARPDPHWTGMAPDPATSCAPYRLYNIGNHQPVQLLDVIATIERCLGKKAEKNLLPMQSGDVVATCADIEDLRRDVGFAPSTPLQVGIERSVAWYRSYYGG